jgi:hypothetical protein
MSNCIRRVFLKEIELRAPEEMAEEALLMRTEDEILHPLYVIETDKYEPVDLEVSRLLFEIGTIGTTSGKR